MPFFHRLPTPPEQVGPSTPAWPTQAPGPVALLPLVLLALLMGVLLGGTQVLAEESW